MEQPKRWIVDHSREAIGRVWTAEDHEHLAHTIREVDRTAVEMFKRVNGRLREAREQVREMKAR
jgi:hypothetical protein